MKKKRLISFIIAVTMVMSLAVSPVMAWSAVNTKCYTITTGNTMVYNSNSTSSGKKGTIYGSDEIKILSSYSNGFYYVEYPIKNGKKQGYILKSDVLISTSASTRYATSKITTYRRNNTNNTYGSIYKNDEVLVFGTRGNFTQIRYPVSGGYKFAWIKNSDANNYLKKTKAVNPTSVSLKVKLTNGSMYSNNGGFYLDGSSSSAQMKAVVSPSNADQSVTWSSGNTGIVKISSSGYATPVSNGTTTITARTVNGKTATCNVTVRQVSSPIPVTREITVYKQTDKRWKAYPYGYSSKENRKKGIHAYLGQDNKNGNGYGGGCGVLAVVNAVYYLKGTFIQPKWLADFSVSTGARYDGGTYGWLAERLCAKNGSDFGIKFVTDVANVKDAKAYLKKGNVAIVHVQGHFMALVNYNSKTDKYLVIDSCPSGNRGTSYGYRWLKESEFTGKMALSWTNESKGRIHIISRR